MCENEASALGPDDDLAGTRFPPRPPDPSPRTLPTWQLPCDSIRSGPTRCDTATHCQATGDPSGGGGEYSLVTDEETSLDGGDLASKVGEGVSEGSHRVLRVWWWGVEWFMERSLVPEFDANRETPPGPPCLSLEARVRRHGLARSCDCCFLMACFVIGVNGH